MTFIIMTLNLTKFSIMKLNITTFSIMTLNINGLFVTLSINDIQHNKSAIVLSVFMLSVMIFLLLC